MMEKRIKKIGRKESRKPFVAKKRIISELMRSYAGSIEIYRFEDIINRLGQICCCFSYTTLFFLPA